LGAGAGGCIISLQKSQATNGVCTIAVRAFNQQRCNDFQSIAPLVSGVCSSAVAPIMTSLRAALFDLDGTLCNSDHLHFAAWHDELAAAHNAFDLSYEDYKNRISGKPNALIAQEFLPSLDEQQRVAACASKEARFRELASDADALQPLKGLPELIASLQSNQFQVACVTNAPRVNAEFMLRRIGMLTCFEHLIVGEECSSSKPSPEPYLEAMRRFKVEPYSCVIFEDSFSGLAAALASGCALAVGLCTTHSAATLKRMGAHAAFVDFSHLGVDELRRMHADACGFKYS
jgi:HAD superfamily hydrolase (TIGR01509 family)